MIKKFSTRYVLVRFIDFKSLSVGHLIELKDIGSFKKHAITLGCLCKAFLREGCDTFAKWRKLKIRAVIKYFCKKERFPKEIHEYLMEKSK